MSELAQEIAALTEAVTALALKVRLEPGYCAADRLWKGSREEQPLAEWDVQKNKLRVRAGMPEGIPGVFLVNFMGDMHALSVADTQKLIEVLAAAVVHVTSDDVYMKRVHKTLQGEDV